MVEYYVVVDNIIDENNLEYRLYKFDPEISLKPVRVNKVYKDSVQKIIDIAEISLCKNNDCKFYILGNDSFLNSVFENNILEFSHIQIHHSRQYGYRVVYRTLDNEVDNVVIDLLDISAKGIFRYLKKLKI